VAMTLPYVQSITGCRSAAIGAHGLDDQVLGDTYAGLAAPLAELKSDYQSRRLAILRIAEDTADIADAEAALARLSQGAKTIVFFGTGGSALGGQTLAQLGGWNIPGAANDSQRGRPRTRFYDNLDPATMSSALATLDLATTRFVVTSKSGSTVETLSQMIATITAIKSAGLGARIPELFLGLTEPAVPGKSNGLRDLCQSLDIATLNHHTGIGGRFSVLTNVGLLPALARGLDVRKLRAGARAVVDAMLVTTDPQGFAPADGAAVAFALNAYNGVATHVMMPYADRLGKFSEWFAQLWGESLGKDGKGTSPIACLGPLDQHSQLQLLMEGPHDHLITIMRVTTKGHGPAIDANLATKAGIGFMGGLTIGDLVDAQASAVPEALARAGRPVRTIDIPVLDEFALGALMMHFMLETMLTARLMGIDAFDQPGVELAKVLTRDRLSGKA
jgi:glucose-6-phosphate isomerase